MKKLLKASLGLAAGGALIGFSAPANADLQTVVDAFTDVNTGQVGMAAPTASVGTDDVQSNKGTIQFSNSIGSSDAFSVGTTSSINAAASASSTPDYAVNSSATFGINASEITQTIGTAGVSQSNSTSNSIDIDLVSSKIAETKSNSDFTKEVDSTSTSGYRWRHRNRRTNEVKTYQTQSEYETAKEDYTKELKQDEVKTLTESFSNIGTISGTFNRTDSSNDVTVKGIGANNAITADTTSFNTNIVKAGIDNSGTVDNPGESTDSAGTANGSASGSVSTTASANASASQFVSSFAQAY